ncbi:hypothetical protein EHS25_009764 [Saitozyma podzolica]|uniref:Major facilitator superfamily (MFS) profile domain-containing protein n=1 Tax=Saitozyma podzolica TaxID=1890683 RepID=A0A427YK49_9TREE|nr:hypothetical protein EHS25_009764 [Saitozyma podzolica]
MTNHLAPPGDGAGVGAGAGAHPPSPIPPYLRPANSRHHSSTSISSRMSASSRRPHPQHREYVPSATGVSGVVGGEVRGDDGLAERLLFDEADAEHDEEAEGGDEENEELSLSEEEYPDDWDNMRDGSISRRPAWRRPSPRWVYPFVVGAALAMGMALAPRSELFINLACLSHPPQVPRSEPSQLSQVGQAGQAIQALSLSLPNRANQGDTVSPQITPGNWTGNEAIRINTTVPTQPDWTPADEWFLRLQRDIYQYKLHHVHSASPPSNPPTAVPSQPLPKPTGPAVPGESQPSPTPTPDDPSSPSNKPQSQPPYHEIDPRLCKKDPKVQAAAAKLTMMITVTAGLLSALTTGFWGATSDRIGRTKVMSIAVAGFLLNECCFIVVATFPYLVPGGYRALLVGPAIDGMLGGFSLMSATVHAYISDVTPDGSRATVFARLGGVMMAGLALGPVLGSTLIKATDNIMVPFYLNVCVHLTFMSLMFFLLPESLSSEARVILTKNAQLAKERARRRDQAEREWENETPASEPADPHMPIGGDSGWSRLSHAGHSKRRKRLVGNLTRLLRSARAPLQPLAIFLPRERDDGTKDYNLTAAGCAIFCASMLYYTFYAYGWTSAQLGPYMSLISFLRGVVLIVLIPITMHFVKPYFVVPQRPPPPPASTSAFSALSGISSTTDASDVSATPAPAPTAKPGKLKRSALLDLLTIRISLLIEMSVYTLLTLNLSPTGFVIASMCVTLASATGPTANSLALSLLPNSREAGRLFGALSVIHALGATLLSPLLFGTLFAYTVGWYAPTVFALAACFALLTQLCFAFKQERQKGKE